MDIPSLPAVTAAETPAGPEPTTNTSTSAVTGISLCSSKINIPYPPVSTFYCTGYQTFYKKFLTSKIGNILLCIAEIIVGVLLLVNPDAVTSAFIIGAGAVMILTGIVFCTLYFVGEAEKMVIKQLLFKGLLLIILGVLCVTQYGVLLAALPFVTWVYAIAMLILAAYKVQCTVDILRLSGIRWYFPAISAALAVVLALFILLNPNTAMNIVWGFMGVSIILEAGLEIATIILLK